jgi:hypothetical protein
MRIAADAASLPFSAALAAADDRNMQKNKHMRNIFH